MSPRRLPAVAMACAALALLIAGCTLPEQASFKRTFTIDGGQVLEFGFGKTGLIAQENQDMRMRAEAYHADPVTKSVIYLFSYDDKTGKPPRKVLVEDVTGPGTEILVEDTAPVLDGHTWFGHSGPKVAGDGRLAWLDEPDESARIYRFTVITADGRRSSLYQAFLYGYGMKAEIKKALGIEEADPAPAPTPTA